MKVKLLMKLRNRGRNRITIYSVTTQGGVTTGMTIGHPGGDYRGLFNYGDTEDDVRNKAMNIYMKNNMNWIRTDYKKYTRKYKIAKNRRNK